MYLKYILSIVILSIALFGANIEEIESFNEHDKKPDVEQTIIESNNTTYKTEIEEEIIKISKPKEQNSTQKIEKKERASNYHEKSTSNEQNKSRAKFVIIIDDISHKYQLNRLKKMPFKVTPSIFPPTKMNMNSQKLALGLKHFMVHLPLESNSKQMNKIYKLLRVNSTKKEIINRVEEIRRLFPNAKYINNHTGSKFTSNYIASKNLYKALMDNSFIFVDSRTSQNSKIAKIAQEFHKKYFKNDLFIDNNISTPQIIKELKKGIALANSRGYAVVIGHPHPQTFKALQELSKQIKKLNTVYIDEL